MGDYEEGGGNSVKGMKGLRPAPLSGHVRGKRGIKGCWDEGIDG